MTAYIHIVETTGAEMVIACSEVVHIRRAGRSIARPDHVLIDITTRHRQWSWYVPAPCLTGTGGMHAWMRYGVMLVCAEPYHG